LRRRALGIMSAMISIIIPALNEAEGIAATLQHMQSFRRDGHELLLADGGSHDNTVALATPMVDQVLGCAPGRATQMNVGAHAAKGDILWFVHADTVVQAGMDRLILSALRKTEKAWGHFTVRLSGKAPLLRVVETAMNWRSSLTGIATGDQGLFVRRETFEQLNGYAEIPLMEDIEICGRLKRSAGAPLRLSEKMITSSRRWESRGILRTVLLMWRLRFSYFFGTDPAELARRYQ